MPSQSPAPRPVSALRLAAAGLIALAAAMGIGRFAFTPLLPLMRAEGLLTVADGGTLAFAHFLGYLIGALCAARLPLPPRPALCGSLLAIGLLTLGMGLTHSLPLWLVFRWLAGLASAFTLVLASTHIVGRLAAGGAHRLQGWVFAGVGVGIMLAGLGTLAMMVEDVPSADGWFACGAAVIAASAAVWALIGDGLARPLAARTAERGAGARVPLAWPLLAAYGAMGIGYVIPATYLPLMARAIVPSPLVFGWSWPLFGLAAFLSTLLAARLPGTVRQIWAVSQLVMAAGLVLPALTAHIGAVVLAGICVGGTFMIITMAGIKEALARAPSDAQRHIAAMTAAFAICQMLGPPLAASIHDATGSFAAPLLIASLALAITAAPLLARASKEPIPA